MEKLDHTEVIREICIPSYDMKSFAMQLRAAASIRRSWNRNSPKGEELMNRYCAKLGLEPEVIKQLCVALNWDGKLEFENEVKQILKDLE